MKFLRLIDSSIRKNFRESAANAKLALESGWTLFDKPRVFVEKPSPWLGVSYTTLPVKPVPINETAMFGRPLTQEERDKSKRTPELGYANLPRPTKVETPEVRDWSNWIQYTGGAFIYLIMFLIWLYMFYSPVPDHSTILSNPLEESVDSYRPDNNPQFIWWFLFIGFIFYFFFLILSIKSGDLISGVEASEAVDYISSVSQTDIVSIVDMGTQTSSHSWSMGIQTVNWHQLYVRGTDFDEYWAVNYSTGQLLRWESFEWRTIGFAIDTARNPFPLVG
jgi:hypothetical protein